MSEIEKATPRPWEVNGEDEDGVAIVGLCTDLDRQVIYGTPTNGLVAFATMHPTEHDIGDYTRANANAALIVRAVNHYDELVAALREMVGLFGANGVIRFDADHYPMISDAVRGARALLSKVRT